MKKYIYAIWFFTCLGRCLAGESLQFGGVKGKSVAVRISAIQLVIRSGGYLEVSTASQVIRVKVDPKTGSPTDDLDATTASYFAIIALMEERNSEVPDGKAEEWMNTSEDKKKSSTVRSVALSNTIAYFRRVDCVEIDVSTIQKD